MFFWWLGCTQEAQDSSFEEETSFRIVLLADSHVIGPNYVCCSESEGIDNSSIMKTPERLRAAVDKINLLDPQPDLVFLMGDVVHDAYVGDDLSWYLSNESAFEVASGILSELSAPFYPVFGNHDYHYRCDGSGHSKQLSHDLFKHYFQAEPYYAVSHKGFRFVVTNSQLGATWDSASEQCDTSLGSYGATQLEWIEEQLDAEEPTFVFAHHMLAVTKSDEEEGGEYPGLRALLEAKSDRLEGLYVGHTHRWIDFTETYGFTHIVMGATRYDDDNFWLLELDSEMKTAQILDKDKSGWATPCAEDWLYDGMVDYEAILNDLPYPNPEQEEDGDCE